MRSAVLLSLLVFLALSDGANRQNNNRYDEFKKKHILPTGFQTNEEAAWWNHLVDNCLCVELKNSPSLRTLKQVLKKSAMALVKKQRIIISKVQICSKCTKLQAEMKHMLQICHGIASLKNVMWPNIM